MSVSRKDDNRRKEEISSMADEAREASPTNGSGSAEVVINAEPETPRRRILHRVPPQMRENKRHIYDPLAVSLGPYHHGQPQLRRFEGFKDEVLNIMLDSRGGANNKGGLFRSEILARLDEIRSFYEGLSRDEYGDEDLAEMMLRDACFILCYMEMVAGNNERFNHICRRVGLFQISIMSGDCLMLENQIPFWIIKLLISLTVDDEGKSLICKYLSMITFGDYNRMKEVPWDEDKEPLHLLEAIRTTCLIKRDNPTFEIRSCWKRKRSSSRSLALVVPSATELKSKGIWLRCSSDCLKDIRFTSYYLFGVLHLPILVVNSGTKALLSNVIALEMSPETETDFAVISYVNFMKSLIEETKDVKELQKKGILFSAFPKDEEVVRMFKEIDTYGVDNRYIFNDIKKRINEHCHNKAKTWIAELILTYFRTPWTAIALLAAIIVLFLTFAQTYYTVRPAID